MPRILIRFVTNNWSMLTMKGSSKKAKTRLRANGKVSTVANGQPTTALKQIAPTKKIAFALYKSGKLRQQLDDLNKAIDNLDKFSQIQFRRQQRSNSTDPPTREELGRAGASNSEVFYIQYQYEGVLILILNQKLILKEY